MYCKYCGSRLSDDSKFCQFCGNKVVEENENKTQEEAIYVEDYNSSSQTSTTAIDGYATAGFVLGILTLFCVFTFIPGLIFSIMGLKSQKNKGQAIAGLVLSIIPVAIIIIILLILFVLMYTLL